MADQVSDSGAGPSEPGTCLGKNTHCERINFEPLDWGPHVCGTASCAPESYQGCDPEPGTEVQLTPEWLVDLDTVSCPAPGCLQRVQELAPSQNRELWINAQVWTPSAEDPNGADPVGASLLRLDATGHSMAAPVTILRSILSDAIPTIRGIQPGPNGDLFRAAPSRSFRSVEVQRYDASGQRMAAYDTVNGTVDATVAWGKDGSATVAYSYLKNGVVSPDGGSVVPARAAVNVARFDASGRLLWNQTGLEFTNDDPGYVGEGFALTVDTDDNATVVLPVTSDPRTVTLHVAKFDREGNLIWARLLPGWGPVTGPGATVSSDGNLVVVHSDSALVGEASAWVVDEIAPDGSPAFRLIQTYPKDDSLPPVIDGRRLLQAYASDAASMRFQAMNLDSNSCVNFEIPVPGCPETTGPSGCPARSMAAANGMFYFSVGTRIGAVALP